MTSKTVAIFIVLALCLSMVLVLAPTLASLAQASPMQTLHLTCGPPTFLKYTNARPISFQPGDEIIQFTRPNLIVGTNPTASFSTAGRWSNIVTGDLSGTMIADFSIMNATWDGLGTSKGYAIHTFTFNDGYGNTFSGVMVVDLDFTGAQYPITTGYMVSTSGTGTFSGQVLIGTISADTNAVGTTTLRRYASSEVSGPDPISLSGTSIVGGTRSLGSSIFGVQENDEFIQFTRANIVVPKDTPAFYNEGILANGSVTGALTGTMTHNLDGIGIALPGPGGGSVGKFSYSDGSGTIRGVQVHDTLQMPIPPSPATGQGYLFAMAETGITGVYSGSEYFITYNMTGSSSTYSCTGNLYTLTPGGQPPTPTPPPTPAPTPTPPEGWTEYTPQGTGVVVGSAAALVQFNTVAIAGQTIATPTEQNPGGSPPPNFDVIGWFWDITTMANYSGPITVCFSYDPSQVGNEGNLKLFHWNGTGWDDVTTEVNAGSNTICGQVNALSPFFIGESVSGTGEGCFIATAAYGSYLDSHVETLRDFRDSYMVTNPIGRSLVSAYYKLSPPLAGFIDDHPTLKPIVRVGLLPAVAASTVAVDTTMAEKMAIVGSLALVSFLMLVWLRKSRQNP